MGIIYYNIIMLKHILSLISINVYLIYVVNTHILIMGILFLIFFPIMVAFVRKHISFKVFMYSFLFVILIMAIGTYVQLVFGLNYNLWASFDLSSIDFVHDSVFNFACTFNLIALFMILLLLLLSTMVIMFGFEYLARDIIQYSSIQLLVTFTGIVLLFVTSNTLSQMYFCWELAGTLSYQLLIIYTARLRTASALARAYSAGRASDTFLCYASIMIVDLVSTDYVPVINLIWPFIGVETYCIIMVMDLVILDIIAVLLLLAGIAKSAQFIFLIWLPDAMEAPTPASALIHSSTLVVLGLYIIFKLYPVITMSTLALNMLYIVSTLTIFYSSFFAMYTGDFKKSIAYSTIGQIAYIYFMLSVYGYFEAFAYLILHAICKAAVFVIAGYIIHLCGGYTTYRHMGGLFRFIPHIALLYVILLLTLAGFPLLTGFYTKELILHRLFKFSTPTQIFVIGLWLYSVAFSILYLIKLIHLPIFGTPRMSYYRFKKIAEHFKKNHIEGITNFKLIRYYSRMQSHLLMGYFTFIVILLLTVIALFSNEFMHAIINTMYFNITQFPAMIIHQISIIQNTPISLMLAIKTITKITIVLVATVALYTIKPKAMTKQTLIAMQITTVAFLCIILFILL